jgi:hypothetical protein
MTTVTAKRPHGDISPGKEFTIYAVVVDKHGYAKFLLYINSRWDWVSAKYFEPTNNGGVCNI